MPLCVFKLFQKLLEYDIGTANHSLRVTEQGLKFGRELNLKEDEFKNLIIACSLHDIGKIKVPKDVLNKKGKLNDEEWEIMRYHPQYGYEMIKEYEEIEQVAPFVLYHHEKIDGSGYLSGLCGTEIPYFSRIISVLDTYDVITHARSYKKASSKNNAVNELKRCSGTQFDEQIVDAFLKSLSK